MIDCKRWLLVLTVVLGGPLCSAAAADVRVGYSEPLENLSFARGGADLALVARAVARGQGLPIPPAWHPAIEQHALVLSASRQPALARSFQRFITGAVGRAQILSFGYRACS